METSPNSSIVPLLGNCPPHGGQLVNRRLGGSMKLAVQDRAEELLKIDLSSMNPSDLELIASGAMSPLTGFMVRADYEKMVSEMRLRNNLLRSLPVTLPVEGGKYAVSCTSQAANFSVVGMSQESTLTGTRLDIKNYEGFSQ